MSIGSWLLVELGGSAAQTVQRDTQGRFWFSPGIVREPGRPVALACPGLIREGRVLYASNLGWPDDADPAQELGLARIAILANDAHAAGLGEAVLRAGGTPDVDLVYITLGTGVGDALVVDGAVQAWNFAHHFVGGSQYCTGCRSTGCLNAYLCAQALPRPLSTDDCAAVAGRLASTLTELAVDPHLLVVLGGGIARRYPAIATTLADRIPNRVELTAIPAEAKSAAYAGLDYLARLPSLQQKQRAR
jgi:predicted NBD/HSP70 family sugar kinase